MKHVVFFSGGIASWGTADRVREAIAGDDEFVLLFTDTLIEDPDLYRFLEEAAADLGGRLVWLKEGRDPWDVFFDVRLTERWQVLSCQRDQRWAGGALQCRLPALGRLDGVGRPEHR